MFFDEKEVLSHVRMLSPNKSCSKDNLDQVIDMQQYNPLIHQQLRESKIQAVMYIFATTKGPWGKSTELFQAVECATQRAWHTHGRRAKKYGPATIREVQIAVSKVLDYILTQQHFVAAGMEREQQAAIFVCFFFPTNNVILHTFVISLPSLDML